ncbi:MAG: hypothetical protein U0V75_11165 [Ferruginibacter sp.]
MKIFKSFFIAILTVGAFLSCQKELNFDESGVSTGSFKKDGTGNCAPVTLNGIYKVDSTLDATNFVDVQVNVSNPGSFDIKSDTINGFSFRKAGSVIFGTNTIRLYATGKPIAAGTNTFTVTYGTSTCKFAVTVVPVNTSGAVYTIGGAPNACTGAIAGGTYVAGVPLAPSNTLTIQVNVTVPGYYVIGAATTNGFVFSGTGVFTSTGLQNVVLTGTGTPVNAGPTVVTVSNFTAACTFAINVDPAGGGGPAAFTLDGSPGGCTSFTLSGTYAATVAMAAGNTVKLNVTVTTAGSYNISTNTANGVTFSGSGSLALGAQQITLTASGTPAAAGPFTFKPNVASSCDFAVTFTAAPSPAVFTLSGSPGACAPITVSGSYFAGTALNATNTAVVQVNVTSTGTYTLSTNTVNGMIFSASGLFTTTGLQNVTLTGSGTPTNATATTLTPQAGTSSCTFQVNVTSGTPSVFQCKIDGVLNVFTDQAEGTYFVPGDLLIYGGKLYASFPDEFYLEIDRSSVSTTVNTGTYVNTLAGSTAGGYLLWADYTDGTNAIWSPASIFSTPDPFTITITTLTATRVVGTFSGTIRSSAGSGTSTKTVTEGVFNLPVN